MPAPQNPAVRVSGLKPKTRPSSRSPRLPRDGTKTKSLWHARLITHFVQPVAAANPRERHDVCRVRDVLLVNKNARAVRVQVLLHSVKLLHVLAQLVEGLGGHLVACLVNMPRDGIR